MCHCRIHKCVWSVCAHTQTTQVSCEAGKVGTRAPRSVCAADRSFELILGMCPDCEKWFEPADVRSEHAILNYWAYKWQHGWAKPVDPSLVSKEYIFGKQSNTALEYVRSRLECVALASAISGWDNRDDNIADVVQYVENIRASTLSWARNQEPRTRWQRRKYLYSMVSYPLDDTPRRVACPQLHVETKDLPPTPVSDKSVRFNVSDSPQRQTERRRSHGPYSPYPGKLPEIELEGTTNDEYEPDSEAAERGTIVIGIDASEVSLPPSPEPPAHQQRRKPRLLDLYKPQQASSPQGSSSGLRTPHAPPRPESRLARCSVHGKNFDRSLSCNECLNILLEEKTTPPSSLPNSPQPSPPSSVPPFNEIFGCTAFF